MPLVCDANLHHYGLSRACYCSVCQSACINTFNRTHVCCLCFSGRELPSSHREPPFSHHTPASNGSYRSRIDALSALSALARSPSVTGDRSRKEGPLGLDIKAFLPVKLLIRIDSNIILMSSLYTSPLSFGLPRVASSAVFSLSDHLPDWNAPLLVQFAWNHVDFLLSQLFSRSTAGRLGLLVIIGLHRPRLPAFLLMTSAAPLSRTAFVTSNASLADVRLAPPLTEKRLQAGPRRRRRERH